MCGFAGIFAAPGPSAQALADTVGAMASRIDHRGPDDQGSWIDPAVGLGLGFRRLSIVDLSQEGHQPMRSASGRFTLVFNGEVYNHEALRRELAERGAKFRGSSDTEVILAAFEEWGLGRALGRMEGMFAIALWDARERSLTLIRDRLGIKPLFYQVVRGRLLFGSELKALAAHPDFDPSLDTVALTAYLRHLYVPAPRTIYENARKLLPGHLLTIRDPARPLPDPEPYWSLKEVARRGIEAPFSGSADEAVDALETLLLDSVRGHLRADVPLGAFLSAGVDSSTVVSMMQELLPHPVRSFSVAFDAKEHNEAPEAARVAKHIGTDHTELLVTGQEALDLVPALPDLFDEPLADISQIPVYILCAKARQQLTVALSGDGGDEVFWGYNRYAYGPDLVSRLSLAPQMARRLLAAGIGTVSSRWWDRVNETLRPALPNRFRQRLVGEKVHKVGRILGRSSPEEMYRSVVSSWPEPEDLVVGGRDAEGAFERALRDGHLSSLLERVVLADQLTYLPDDQLAKVDRVSMAVGLEVRVPLVDHRVVEFAWSLPADMKIRERQGKWILRQVLYRRVPRELMERPKMGLSVPVGAWLRGPLRDWAESLLDEGRLRREGVLQPRPIRCAWSALLDGREEGALGLWAVLMFQAWQERWLS